MDDAEIFGPPRSEAELDWVIDTLCSAFQIQPEWARRGMDLTGHERVLLLRSPAGKPISTARYYDFAQWFGGRAVRSAGVAGVAVRPEDRGCGAGREVMDRLMAELRRLNFPLASLFPATLSLYRRSGFERAGSYTRFRLPTTGLRSASAQFQSASKNNIRTRILTDADRDAMFSLSDRRARLTNGALQRNAVIWDRIQNHRVHTVSSYAFEREGQLAGYVHLHQEPHNPPYKRLVIDDMALADRQIAEHALSFLSQFDSLVKEVIFYGSASEDCLHCLAERNYEQHVEIEWMLRIVHAECALQDRGWPRGFRGLLELDLDDETLGANSGRYRLSLEDGNARVETGGAGRIKLNERSFAALYSGFRSAAELAQCGELHADPASLELLQSAFAGPAPAIFDLF